MLLSFLDKIVEVLGSGVAGLVAAFCAFQVDTEYSCSARITAIPQGHFVSSTGPRHTLLYNMNER